MRTTASSVTGVATTVTIALAIALAVSVRSMAAVGGEGITPAPCPAAAWEYGDPAFRALPGATASFGRYDGGLYRIEIPDNWNGDLVLWAHGFVDPEGPMGTQLRVGTPGPLRDYIVSRGYAWAASSYRCNGYAPGMGLLDTMALTSLVTTAAGSRAPARTYLVGASMGGHVTLLGLQEFPTAFAGGLAMCPAGPGEFDFLTSISAEAARLAGPLGTPGAYTDKGRQLAIFQIGISGGPRPFAVEGLAARFADNVRDGERVPRFRPSGPYEELTPFDGRFERPVLTMHGTGDLYVPITLERSLRLAVDEAGTGSRLVQRIMRIAGHCGFSPAEQFAAFDDLVIWVRQGVRPEGDDVMADLVNAGTKFTNPLRPGDPGTREVATASNP